MRTSITALAFGLSLAAAACGGTITNDGGDDNDGAVTPDACVGLECAVARCDMPGQTPTTLTGTVFAPNGTLPLYGADVYVPRDPPGALPEGAQCSRCVDDLPGSPIVRTTTDVNGHFELPNVPSGATVPVVITLGKWRRQITVANVTDCTATEVPATDSRLPRTKAEGDIPKIAITTGNADSLECLVRKLGIDDTEITNSDGAGRVHLYKGNGVGKFKNGFPGGSGQSLSSATPFWNTVDNLSKYDIVILSCEGGQNPDTKSQDALNAMKAYADLGGRVFASHWHNIWIEGSTEGGGNQKPAVWPEIATWSNGGNLPGGTIDLIDEQSHSKGTAFADWMVNVMGSTVRGEIPITEGRTTVIAPTTGRAERWTYVKGGDGSTQNFQFTTPNEAPSENRCGKVVFSDMHVSGGPGDGNYPDSCGGGTTLSPQEKALAFMFFDISSCVGSVGRTQD